MLRSDFDRLLETLQSDLGEMGRLVEETTKQAIRALQNRDADLAQQVIDHDDVIDNLQDTLETKCLGILATQQPAATDLRTVMSVVHMGVELERMGDYAEGIAKICLRIYQEPLLKPLIDIPRMAELALKMLNEGLQAFAERDEDLARKVCADDDAVDDLYDQIYRELLTYMLEDPRNIQRATYLLWVAHDLERIADRATNIAERVIWLISGGSVSTRALKSERSLR
ncbi:Phosphate-specific transport system accessory protein PhoU homolog [Geodia barretti]|uniref:Phosphate-specific transport system accessory protein PhoU homolog n=1 Tax=Geodia barretti TaxID=519541 RepID=A0AA35WKR3_GEOBA|nr:Phosphate-specific transport system accessory protein PhoU homolog [Geodia barretti]